MTFPHRHLAIPPDTRVEDLPLDALDDLLDRGDFDDWRALARAVRSDPRGELGDRILRLCRAHEMYGTSRLWTSFVEGMCKRSDEATPSLAALRRRAGKTQAEMAAALGIRQSDVSKLERRDDLLLSTLRRYVAALGGQLDIIVEFPHDQRARTRLGGVTRDMKK